MKMLLIGIAIGYVLAVVLDALGIPRTNGR
jgi:hypothetical protein